MILQHLGRLKQPFLVSFRRTNLRVDEGKLVSGIYALRLGKLKSSPGFKFLDLRYCKVGFAHELKGGHLHLHPAELHPLFRLHLRNFELDVRGSGNLVRPRVNLADV